MINDVLANWQTYKLTTLSTKLSINLVMNIFDAMQLGKEENVLGRILIQNMINSISGKGNHHREHLPLHSSNV